MYLALAGAFVIVVFFYTETARPWQRIGDGQEYLCTTLNWITHFTPWVKADALNACAFELGIRTRPLGFIEHGEQFDSVHFWLLGFFAAPFVAIVKALGYSFAYGFSVFHCFLFLFVWYRLWRALGLAGAAGIAVLLACSPLLFFMDKGHSEFFLAAMALLCLCEIHEERWPRAAMWMALASCQQAAFTPFALLLILIAALRRREPLPLSAAVLFVFLAPVYYMVRYGSPSLIAKTGTTDFRLISFHRVISLYIDPDLGLLPNWPLAIAGLLIVVALAALRVRTALAGLLLLLALPVFVSVQVNWNGGGTVNISRYAVMLIPAIAFAWGYVLSRIAGMTIWLGPACAALLILLLSGQYSSNKSIFGPQHRETFLFHTQFANWLYDNHPSWYDPVPEVFSERSANVELYSGNMTPRMWIIGNLKCTKLILMRPIAEIPDGPFTGQPYGCFAEFPPDLNKLAHDLKSGVRKPTPLGYINLD